MDEAITLRVQDLSTSFFSEKGEVKAVDHVSFDVPHGSIVGLVGESGCGKSMTARSIMKLLKYPGKIVGGEILLEGRDLVPLSEAEMSLIRGEEIAMIFQEPMTSLNPVVPVGKQVQEAILQHRKISREEAKKKVLHMLEIVGISEPEKRYRCYPHELSGGLRQRVMIAMAMICRPKLLIADEPTTALDVTVEAQILELLRELRDTIGTSIILISHNLRLCVRDVCRPGGGAGPGAGALRPPQPSLYPGAHGLGALSAPGGRETVHHTGGGAEPAAPAPGLSFCSPLPHGRGKLPELSAGAEPGGRQAPGPLSLRPALKEERHGKENSSFCPGTVQGLPRLRQAPSPRLVPSRFGHL